MTFTPYAGYTPPQVAVQPGDWFVVDPSGEQVFQLIERGERLAAWAQRVGGKQWPSGHARRGWWRWGHAGVATRWAHSEAGKPPSEWVTAPSSTWPNAVLLIAEAEPGGAVERPWHWEDCPHMWSAGTGLSVPAMGPAARRYTRPGLWGDHGVPYAFPDYGAIAAKALHIPWPGLDAYMASTMHMICSQLADQAAQDEGVHLFDDGRPPGYVMPLDLALLLQSAAAQVHAPPGMVPGG